MDIQTLRIEEGQYRGDRYVDVYPWVAKENIQENTPMGILTAPRGWLSNGAGKRARDWIFDLCPHGFIWHDCRTANPHVASYTYTKRQVDVGYGMILYNHRKEFPIIFRTFSWIVRPIAVMRHGAEAWIDSRDLEDEIGKVNVIQRNMIPKANNWHFPTWKTKDAEWIPDA